ncbi:vitamin K epoxide reductase family protein [Luteipulveratus halotolerans]|uniref:Vitamin K epoxide reductase n=1 Tax=Luteipulveratus halotolerans TaxID=1631356 RepID=A0A0L6CE59_9MICO|nr:vitamin K epoxide reductase family protein [Luteipulveratus halotolerans]KNX35885.1 vitamin K epoxide reductase [Luteipulveratus halotolerans]
MTPSSADAATTSAYPETQGADAGRRAGIWTLLVCGLIGSSASVVLLVEKIALLKDPSYAPSCSINPVLSCGSIMKTWQAELLGFPNPVLGVVGFAVVTTTAVAVLAGARLQRWYWWGLLGGTTAGVALVHWLIFQSLYRIGALCPYCMLVWVVTVAAFLATAVRLRRELRLPLPVAQYAPTIAIGWALLVATLIAIRFWDYWSTLL